MLFIFGRSVHPSLSEYFAHRAKTDGHQTLFASMGEFEDSEPFCELERDPKGQLCVIFQSITNAGGFNASSNYMQMLACADNLRRAEASKIWAVNPMAGFMRQDKIREGRRESLLSELAGKLMREAGISGLSTVEAHSLKAIENYEQGLGKGNVLNINPNDIFETGIRRLDLSISSVANPDLGADSRAADLANRLGAERFSIDKERNKEGTKITGQHGVVAHSTALIDDIASSLGTAKNAIELLYKQGSKENILLISHAVMTGKAWDNLAKLIKSGMLQKVLFLPTITREAEFTSFKQQYGPDVASNVIFLNDEYNEWIYSHVTQKIANHPAMRPEGPK